MLITRSTRRARSAVRLAACITACLTLLPAGAAGATDIIYQPVNPAFGGYPTNGQHLLATATATNKHVGKDGLGRSMLDQSPLAQFNQTLERTVLSQLAAAATSKLTGTDGKLVPGTFSTQNFTISVVDLGGGMLRITTTDKASGAATSFEVAQ